MLIHVKSSNLFSGGSGSGFSKIQVMPLIIILQDVVVNNNKNGLTISIHPQHSAIKWDETVVALFCAVVVLVRACCAASSPSGAIPLRSGQREIKQGYLDARAEPSAANPSSSLALAYIGPPQDPPDTAPFPSRIIITKIRHQLDQVTATQRA